MIITILFAYLQYLVHYQNKSMEAMELFRDTSVTSQPQNRILYPPNEM